MTDEARQALRSLLFASVALQPGLLFALAAVLPDALLSRAIGVTRAISDAASRARILQVLAARLPEVDRDGLLREALAATQSIAEPYRRRQLLVQLVPNLSQPLEALAVAETLDRDWDRAEVLAALAPRLLDPFLPEVLALVGAIRADQYRAEALASLAPRLSEPQLRAVLAAAVLWIRNDIYRATAVGKLQVRLAALGHPQEALSGVRTIGYEYGRANALVELAPFLSEPLLAEALAVARAISDVSARNTARVGLAPYLPESLVRHALTEVQAIESKEERAQTLAALALRLMALGYPQDALATARAIEVRWYRDPTFASVAPLLVALGYESEALSAARATREDLRGKALVDMALQVSERRLSEVLGAAQAIEEPWLRMGALIQLAPGLPEPLSGIAILDALAAARATEVDQLRALALADLVPHLPDPLVTVALTEAHAALLSIEHDGWRTTILLELAGRLLPQLPTTERDPLLVELLELLENTVELERGAADTRNITAPPPLDLTLGRPPPAEPLPTLDWLRSWLPGGKGPGEPQRERVVNTGFAPEAEPEAPLERTQSLESEGRYYFLLNVGWWQTWSIEEVPAPPPEPLPPDARLTVVLFAFDDEIRITPGADVGELQFRPDGTVRVARQPTQPPGLPPGSDLLEEQLFFPVQAPHRVGTFRLRCSFYFQQTLVQSRLIRARVMRRPHYVKRALRSTVDYTIAPALDPAHLTRIGSHKLSLMLNSNGDGTHGFRFFGSDGRQWIKDDVSLDALALEDLIQQARGALRLAAWGDEQFWQEGQAYLYEKPVSLMQFEQDLTRLAIRGYRFYDTLINRLAGGAAQATQLAHIMLEPGRVQIAIKESASNVVPAALIYDYPLDTNSDGLTLCAAFLAALAGPVPLEQSSCFQGSCPSRENQTVVCPGGFWGYRHSLGMPLSIGSATDVPPEISYRQGPDLAVAVSTDPGLALRSVHEKVLRSLKPDLCWHYAQTRAEALTLLKTVKPHLVYFYCHGGVANNVPFIQVGPITERGITRDNLRSYAIFWEQPRPLVILNGCHTTALEPNVALEFVSALVETAGASGVIGTEITIFEPLACAFAEECLRRFLAGAPIGEAVRGARLKLLKARNPLGLVYIPFALASLRLTEQPVSR